MNLQPIDLEALQGLLRVAIGPAELPLLLVDLALDVDGAPVTAQAPHSGFPYVVVGLTDLDRPEMHPAAAACDVVLTRGAPALEAIYVTVAAQPLAATALVQVLRRGAERSIDDGLLVESAVYSTLQAGPEFARWRAGRAPRERPAEGAPVQVARDADRLDITLTRPQVRNALNSAMRDALVDAFRLVAVDDTITDVHLRGTGPAFCAGGDLDEFGSFPDPATAHTIRLVQSVGRAIADVATRVTVHLHGACYGSGIELPAFARTVSAAPDTTIALPEVALGLIPGAGGTVSLPRRVGRHRTARLALTGELIDAATALAWGLIDVIEQPDPD